MPKAKFESGESEFGSFSEFIKKVGTPFWTSWFYPAPSNVELGFQKRLKP